MSVFLALLVGTVVARAILPGFHTLTILEIILPVTFVLSAIYVNVDSVAIGFVILPLSVVNVTISMPEFSFAVGLIFPPFTLVFGVIGPDLDAGTVSHFILEVAFVDSAVFKGQLLNKLEAILDSLGL